MDITPYTILPDNAYWVCNDKYNGLSQLIKFNTTQRIADVVIKPFGNVKSRAQASASKISKTILAQLNLIAYLSDDTTWYS